MTQAGLQLHADPVPHDAQHHELAADDTAVRVGPAGRAHHLPHAGERPRSTAEFIYPIS